MIIEEKDEKKIEERKEIMEFIQDFNQEAESQKSGWFAELQFGKHPHITRHTNFWWFFILSQDEISYQLCYYNNQFFFTDNDYFEEQNSGFLKDYKEFKPILEKLKQKFVVRVE